MSSKSASPANSTILVTGDFLIDHHVYEGKRHHFSDQNAPGVCVKEELGGAALIHRLLTEMQAQSGANWKSILAIDEDSAVQRPHQCSPPSTDCQNEPFGAYAFWRPYPADPKIKQKYWRVAEAMGFGGGQADNSSWPWQTATKLPNSPTVLVIADGGMGFRSRTNAHHWRIRVQDWRLLELGSQTPKQYKPQIQWIVLKMSAPIGQGDLWRELTSFYAGRLVVIVGVNELRLADVRIGASLSWEQTLEDVHRALRHNPDLRTLTRCRHLIVSFGAEGALWMENDPSGKMNAMVIFDGRHVEGERRNALEGNVYGYLSCLAGTIAASLASHPGTPPMESAIRAGLCSMRQLLEFGHGDASRKGSGFPTTDLALASRDTGRFDAFQKRSYPCEATLCPVRPGWSLIALHESTVANRLRIPLYGIARRVLIQGATVLQAPTLKVGGFFTADRGEIEALRSLRLLIQQYLHNKKTDKPLSVGVFGPPGAGKSFAVKELAGDMLKDKLGWLEFNLSQFNGAPDLIGALHQVRDKSLEGKLPVAFFDEFDSQNLLWLKYLLAPMQDGKFQEGQMTHPIGQCLFFFAGGTSPTFEGFAAKADDVKNKPEERRHFILSKGPDFASRLDGKLNVIGPNPRESRNKTDDDIFFPVRRALFIRSNLQCEDNERLSIHSGLVTALLEIPSFRHGSRSLTKLLEPFRACRRDRPNAALALSSLPSQDQLALHVDVVKFDELIRRGEKTVDSLGLDKLAAAVQAFYRRKGRQEGWVKPQHDRNFRDLSLFDQASNRAAARRIPAILALAGLRLARGQATKQERRAAESVLDAQIDILAEAEHDGWMEWHLDNGWSQSHDRSDALLHHDLLIPYSALKPNQQDKDKSSIRHFPEIVGSAGLKIVPIAKKARK